MRLAFALGIVAAAAGVAGAGPAPSLADEVAAHDDAAIARLAAHRADPVARCALGAAYALRGDLGRADLYLTGCTDVALPDELAVAVARARRGLHEKLADSDLAELHVATEPEGLAVRVPGFTDDVLASPVSLWVPAGTYAVTIGTEQRTVTPEPRKRTTVFVDARAKQATAPAEQVADFTSETAAEAPATGGPPDVKHPPMTAAKWRGVAEAPSGPQLEDPFVTRSPLRRRVVRQVVGLRVGAGMFDDGAAHATEGLAVAATARLRLIPDAPWCFLALRADWSRRGGDASSAAMSPSRVDALGAAVGAGVFLVSTRDVALMLVGQLRGDVRLPDSRGDAGVHRLGLGVATGVEVTIPHSPLAVGVRYEQGLTPLVPGAYDRALLGEVGVDLR